MIRVEFRLRGKSVRTSEEELYFLYGHAAEEHGKTVDTDTESAVRRTAILEELKIELNVLCKSLLLSLSLKNVVSVLALRKRVLQRTLSSILSSSSTDVLLTAVSVLVWTVLQCFL